MALRVLITDAEERAALAACRGLSLAGYRVATAASRRPAAAHWSRFCSERFFLPDPRLDTVGFACSLEEVLGRGEFAAVIPGAEASMLAMSDHRERLERHARLGLPPRDVVERAVDKRDLLEAAALAGLSAPPSIICDRREAVAGATRELGFPVVLKPARSFVSVGAGLRQQAVAVASDELGVGEALENLDYPVMVQRFEQERRLVACAGVVADGRLLAATASRIWRTWPPLAGARTFGETIAAPPELLEKAAALVAAIGWQGIFQVQMLEFDGRFSVFDFNPRLFGSLALDVQAGANLPATWCDWLVGRRPRAAAARPGVRLRWEDGELRYFLWQLRRGHARAAAAVLKPHRHVVHAHFRLTDPGPLAARALYLLRRAVGRAFPSRGAAGSYM
jgi:predicted ATP-grasp superfamily ATP-dependent carboligase